MEDTKLPKKELIHELTETNNKSNLMAKPLILTILIVLVLGVGTGYIASNVSGFSGDKVTTINSGSNTSGEIKKGYTAGVNDTKTFANSAEGVVKEGGIDGEGEFHLVRPGGDSQNVYITSSVLDLSKFIGKKIKVWGSTQTAQKAGWLMDVGKVEVM